MAKYLIIGGAGFIGVNFADMLLARGDQVIIFDNFSRPGTLANAHWLQTQYPAVEMIQGDIRLDRRKLAEWVAKAEIVHHLAAQVAVTTSVTDPQTDFEMNALGTFHVLEAVRQSPNQPILMYASTNKVYGGMEDVVILEKDRRYAYRDLPDGVAEDMPLDFHSPYGCSKGAGDQYVRDYARIYGLRTAVMRQSCIYGKHQMGVEDQGWVAWFIIAAVLGKKITIYGDGKQVRDVLYVEDLFRAWDVVAQTLRPGEGRVYNIGGGAENTMSLLELIAYLEEFQQEKLQYTFDAWRPGDQKVYVSNIAKARQELGWQPAIRPRAGIRLLYAWVKQNTHVFQYV